MTSLAVKTSTLKEGTTSTNELVNIVDFFQQNIVPELQSAAAAHPILTADAIKFATTFRNQLPKESYGAIIQTLAPHLVNAQCPPVTVSYIAHCIERLLTVKDKQPDGTKVGRIAKTDLAPVLESLLGGFFSALDREDMKENEYVMKAIMRLISFGQEALLPHVELCMGKLVAKLTAAAANPCNPAFNHYLFETIAALVKNVCTAHPDAIAAFDGTLCPLVQHILDQDVQEFAPYVFQLMTLLLSLHSKAGHEAPAQYLAMLAPLLMPVFWERSSYVPALVPLLVAFLKVASAHIVAQNQVQPILGVFQKLIASKANDHHGFALLAGMVEHVPMATLQPFLTQVFQIVLQRLSTLKTHKFVRGFIVFMSIFVCKHGAAHLFSTLDTVQPNILIMLLEQVWLPGLASIQKNADRKTSAVALIKLVTDCPSLPPSAALWNKGVAHVVPLLESTNADEAAQDEVDGLEEMSGHTAFSKLQNASVAAATSPCADVADARQFFAQSLQKMSQGSPGQLRGLLGGSMEQVHMGLVDQYLATYGCQLH